MSDVTRLLDAATAGDRRAAADLLPLVYRGHSAYTLVTELDGRPTPKAIDFGAVKPISHGSTVPQSWPRGV